MTITKRSKTQIIKIREALLTGPQTNRQLSRLAMRFGARLHNMRDMGFVIKTELRDHLHGTYVYTMTHDAWSDGTDNGR